MKRFLNKRIDTQSSNVLGRFRILKIAIAMLLVFTSQLFAAPNESIIQQQEIKGTVIGADNSPLPGVNILVVGTSNGTETDFDGNYTINANKGDVLQFSFVGMQTQTVTVGNNNSINVTMQEDANALDEVVVVGYGTRKKRDITTAVSQITSKQIEASVEASPEFALQGTTSGILVQSSSGDPNARPTIRIRGVGTLGFNDPLYIIDGVPITEYGAGATASGNTARASDIRGGQNILSLINPSDIASISVLKDAAATAVYGMRASNGVILIETKRGKGGKTTFNFNARRGVRNIRNTIDVLNTTDYTSLLTEEYNNAGLTVADVADDKFPAFLDPSNAAYLGGGDTYDWQDAIQNKNALTEDYNFSAQSGTEKANFYFSGSLSNQESTLIHNSLKRYNATLNSDFKVTKWLKVGETLRVTSSQNDDTKAVAGGVDLITNALKPAWQPIYDTTDPNGFAQAGTKWGDANGGTGVNHLAVSKFNSNKYTILRNLGSVYAEITPLDGLRFKGTVGLDWNNNKREWILSKKSVPYHINAAGTTNYTNRDLTNYSILTEFLGSYTKAINDHNFQFLFNLSKQKIGANWVQSTAQNPIFDDLDRVGFNNSEKRDVESFKAIKIQTGELFKFSYNYNSKYYLDASYRRDGSSVFAPGHAFGNFYGASAAWRISDEAFMKDSSWLDDLKFRVSWGQTGNQETRPFSYLATISLSPSYSFGNTPDFNVPGAFQPGIPFIVDWETATTTNIGFDGVALNHRLNFSLEYYDRLTTDILQDLPLAITGGFNKNPVVNLAEVSNKGVELSFNWNDKVGDLEYNFGMNLTTVSNKVEKLSSDSNGRIIQLGGNQALQEGESMMFIYGYQMEGIFQTQAEVDAWKAEYTNQDGSHDLIAPGDIRFADLYGNPSPGEFKSDTPDKLINANDKTILGKTIPGYFYGFNMGANYKGFDMSMQWQGVGDVQKVNRIKMFGEGMSGHANQLATVKDRWTPNNPSTTMPRAFRNDPVQNTRFSSRYVEDADYLRLQNLQIGYQLDGKIVSKLNLQKLRFYLSGNNLLLFTKYSGLDPGASTIGNTDFNPPATSWLLGMNLTF